MSDLYFGRDAINTPGSETRFNRCRDSVVDAILTGERSANTAADPQRIAAQTRVPRNGHQVN